MSDRKIKRLAGLLFAALTVLLMAIGFTGCDFDWYKTAGGDDEPQSIELTMENYDYYLSIDKVCTSSTVLGGGSIRFWSYKVTITGAISGIYENCSLFYQRNGEEVEHEIKLNAAGYATFNYTQAPGDGEITYVRVQGKILI